MKRIIILTTATGQGHNSAAAAVAGYLESKGCTAVVADVLKTGRKNISGPVSSLYDSLVVHAPCIFGALYHAGELISSPRVHSPIYYLNALYSASFLRKLEAFSPDAVICTHIFSAQAFTYLKLKGRINIPSVGVITDYTCSPFWEETRLDRYVIPAEGLMDEFLGKGIPREKLAPLGIPVGQAFKAMMPKAQARKELGLPDGRIFLVAGGSMGFGTIPAIAKAILELMPDAHVVAVCGRNERYYKKLCSINRVIPYGYTEKMSLLMDAADVLLTKPGGLSATEAAVKRVPIVFTSPIPGGEARNAAFFSQLGMAVVGGQPRQAALAACRLACDRELGEKMIRAQERYINRDAERDIGDMLLRMLGEI